MKKLLIVAGAGASLEFGMPSVKEIDKLFDQWALEYMPLTDNAGQSLYTWVKEPVKDYVCQNSGEDQWGVVNFEQLLHTLQLLGELHADLHQHYYRNALNPFIKLGVFPEIIFFGEVVRTTGMHFRSLRCHLVDKLLEHFRLLGASLGDRQSDNLQLLRNFLTTLQGQFDIGILNLNYDNVMITAKPELKTGFHPATGMFDRSQLYDGSWNFCYHLHGSVHFDMRGDKETEMHKIFWNPDLSSHFASNALGRSDRRTAEGLWHLTSSIIAGLDKANQVLAEPFGPFYMLTDRLVHEADAILFLGYGFSDVHLNWKFPFIRYDKTRHRKVVIVDYADKGQDGLRARADQWANRVGATIPYNRYEMGRGGWSEPKIVAQYRAAHRLERSCNTELPLGVWYDGMLSACRHADRIIAELL